MEPSSSGKKVAGNLYLHRDAVAGLESESRSEIWAAEAVANISQWNVVKLRKTGQKRISLLTYEDFDRPFPALLESVTVDFESRTSVRRSYRARTNPPVLHRKELLLPADHPRREEYRDLTKGLERIGLLRNTSSIGTIACMGKASTGSRRQDSWGIKCDSNPKSISPLRAPRSGLVSSSNYPANAKTL